MSHEATNWAIKQRGLKPTTKIVLWHLCDRFNPDYASDRRAYLACDWLPTKWDWIDPAKDATAEILQIEAGLKSRTQAIAERGYDAEQVDREIAAERKREAELGLDFRRPGSPAQAASGGAGPRDAEGQRRDQQDSGNQEEDGEDRESRPEDQA